MNRHYLPIGVIAVTLLIGAGSLMAHAREPHVDAAPTGAIASVDMEEIYNSSGASAELEAAARQHSADGEQRIRRILSAPYLEINELQEYGELIGKVKLTPEEEKRATAIHKMSEDRIAEMAALQTKPADQLLPADRTRIAHLQELKRTLDSQIQPGLVADFRAQNEGWIAEFRHKQYVQLRDQVGKVAKERGITHVFDTTALVYSVNDLTSTVIQRIGKHSTGKRQP